MASAELSVVSNQLPTLATRYLPSKVLALDALDNEHSDGAYLSCRPDSPFLPFMSLPVCSLALTPPLAPYRS